MKPSQRTILHLDMDAYFAEVERLSNPYLRGKPLIVGGRPGERGVVSTASYEAREFGISSGMPLTRAHELCPHGVFIPCDPTKYVYFSSRILKFLLRSVPKTEFWSIDEAFLDVSDLVGQGENRFEVEGSANTSDGGKIQRGMRLHDMARSIQHGIKERFGLTCSIGGGPNKLIAKMATALHKPEGLTLLDRSSFCRVFWPRPVEALYGVGEKTGTFLRRIGIRTVGDLARADSRSLSRLMGITAESLVAGARGIEHSPVVPHGESAPPKSLGHEHTVENDLVTKDEGLALLLSLTDKVGREMRQEGFVGRTMTVKYRTASFETATRQRTIRQATNENRILYKVAKDLYLENAPDEPIRLVGFTVSKLSPQPGREGQPFTEDPLFEEDRRYLRFLLTLDNLHGHYGPDCMIRAAILREARS